MWIDDDDLDRAIDDVARDMTEAALPVGFTARVCARIDSSARRGDSRVRATRRRPSLAGLWAPALAGLAVAAIALVFVRHEPRTRSVTSVRLHTDIRLNADAPEVRPTADVTHAHATSALATRTNPGPPMRSIDATETNAERAPGPAPAADDLAPNRLEPLTVPAIGIVAVAPPGSIAPDAVDPVPPIAVLPIGEEDPQRRFP